MNANVLTYRNNKESAHQRMFILVTKDITLIKQKYNKFAIIRCCFFLDLFLSNKISKFQRKYEQMSIYIHRGIWTLTGSEEQSSNYFYLQAVKPMFYGDITLHAPLLAYP